MLNLIAYTYRFLDLAFLEAFIFYAFLFDWFFNRNGIFLYLRWDNDRLFFLSWWSLSLRHLLNLLRVNKFHCSFEFIFLFLHILNLAPILIFLLKQLIFDFLLFAYMPTLVELSITETFVWIFFQFVILEGKEGVVDWNIVLLKFCEFKIFFLDLNLNNFEFFHGLWISKVIMPINELCNPLFVWCSCCDIVQMFGKVLWRVSWVILMWNVWLLIVRLNIAVSRHVAE